MRFELADVPDLYPDLGNFCSVSEFEVWVQHVTSSVLETVIMVCAWVDYQLSLPAYNQ